SRTHSRLQTYKAELQARGEKLTLQELSNGYTSNLESSEFLKTFTNAVAGIGRFPLHPSTLQIRKYVAPGQARAVWMDDRPWGGH
ncbi:hypothetical protein Q8G41_28275, partial [Klebsiella pneumoniae]|uniref:hypothetical protein n=1 Tax=Klebsiella pneumoniae TaxID=573 RepID=UPI0030141CE7